MDVRTVLAWVCVLSCACVLLACVPVHAPWWLYLVVTLGWLVTVATSYIAACIDGDGNDM